MMITFVEMACSDVKPVMSLVRILHLKEAVAWIVQ